MENQSQKLDRISALPEDTIEKILAHMPIRDALRTSILSKKWRYCWTRMPKLVFDDRRLELSSDFEGIKKYKLVNAIFHVLLLRRAPILELHLRVSNADTDNEIDQIILHLSCSNKIKKFIFASVGTSGYLLPCSFFKLQGLEHLDLINCIFDPPLINKGFSMLKTLRLNEVGITFKMLQGFLTNCPLLEEFTLIRFDAIEFTECEFVELFKCLPSVQVLKISELYIEHSDAGGMPRELPMSLLHLRILDLNVCFLDLSYVLYVIGSSPNLEKIKLDIYGTSEERYFLQTSNNLLDIQGYMGLNLNHLKEVEIKSFENHALYMEFVKIIMANSPVLKKARIELDSYVSLHEENKMLRDLVNVPFPRASPTANFIIERPKDYQGKEIYSNFVD